MYPFDAPPFSRLALGPVGQKWWPTALPSDNLDYTDELYAIAAQGDTPATASLAVAPSGEGELQPLDLSVNGVLLTAQLSGGQPGRLYRCEVTVTGISGRTWQWVIQILVSLSPALPPVPPPPPAPEPGFGTPVTWTSGATVYGPAIAAVATGLIGVGTNQATALLLQAQTNVIASAPAGTGFILPSILTSGTIYVLNGDPANAATVYPPETAQINALGIDVPASIPPGAWVGFTTQDPADQWWAPLAGVFQSQYDAWFSTLPDTPGDVGSYYDNGGVAVKVQA